MRQQKLLILSRQASNCHPGQVPRTCEDDSLSPGKYARMRRVKKSPVLRSSHQAPSPFDTHRWPLFALCHAAACTLAAPSSRNDASASIRMHAQPIDRGILHRLARPLAAKLLFIRWLPNGMPLQAPSHRNGLAYGYSCMHMPWLGQRTDDRLQKSAWLVKAPMQSGRSVGLDFSLRFSPVASSCLVPGLFSRRTGGVANQWGSYFWRLGC